MLAQQVIDQHASTGARLAIDETQAFPEYVGKRAHARRMLPPDHQPLHTARACDQLVHLGFQQWLERVDEHWRRSAERRHVEARYQTLSIIQGSQGIDASLESDVEVQVGVLRHVLLQYREREIVTCPQGKDQVPFITRVREHAGKIGSQSLDVRLQACARAPLSPHQSLCELCRPRFLTLGPGDERLAKCLFPLPERAPRVPVGGTERLGGMANRAVLHDCREQFEQGIAELRSTLLAGLEGVPKM